MEKKNMIIIIAAIVIIAIVAVAGFIFISSGSSDNKGSTPFACEFMEGNFVGNVSLINNSQSYAQSFKDEQHNIEYNLTTMDNASALMEIYEFQGIGNPEKRTFDNNEWNIYFAEAVPSVDNSTNTTSNESMGIIICEIQKDNEGYVITAVFHNDSDVNFTKTTYGEAYTDYIEPLLKSISLKQGKDVPAIADEFGLSQEEFNQQLELIHQYEAGNTSAIEGSA